MLSDAELTLLEWSTAEYFTGQGTIIDAGCFLGGSTCALARGLGKNRRATGRIHAMDRFIVSEEEMGAGYIKPFPQISQAGSFRSAFDRNVHAYEAFLEVHDGDLTEFLWKGDPVEILFVDVAKTPALDQRLMRQFYPCLIPGQSLLIHQDFLWREVPWLALSMDHLAEYFEPLDDLPFATRVYRNIKSIPRSVLEAFSYETVSLEDAEQAFERVRTTLAEEWIPNHLLNRARFYEHRGMRERVAPLLGQALHSDKSGSVAGHLTDYFSDHMTGPDWLGWSPQVLDPSLGLIAQLSLSEAQIIFALVCGLAPSRLLEVGRARGGSTFVMASALRTTGVGRLVSVDPNCLSEHRITEALKTRLAPWVDFVDGYAPYVLPEAETLAGGKFDFVFLDGDHSEAACERDLRGILPHLQPGAFLLLHDAHFGGIQEAVATCLRDLPLADRGSLVRERCETLSHIPYKDGPSYYGGLRLLQYVPAGTKLYDFGEVDASVRTELERLRVENSRLKRALAQNTREWQG